MKHTTQSLKTPRVGSVPKNHVLAVANLTPGVCLRRASILKPADHCPLALTVGGPLHSQVIYRAAAFWMGPGVRNQTWVLIANLPPVSLPHPDQLVNNIHRSPQELDI